MLCCHPFPQVYDEQLPPVYGGRILKTTNCPFFTLGTAPGLIAFFSISSSSVLFKPTAPPMPATGFIIGPQIFGFSLNEFMVTPENVLCFI